MIEEEDETFDLVLEGGYHKSENAEAQVVEEVVGEGGKIHRRYNDGRRERVFTNGVRREIWEDGYSLVYFTNGDMK